MRGKDSSECLLRALDGEDILLEPKLQDLLRLGDRIRNAVPVIPPLEEAVRRRIWNGAVAGTGKPVVLERRAARIPRLAWAVAAALALALAAVLVLIFVYTGGGPAVEPVEIARLRMVQGEIRVLSPQGEEHPALEGEVLKEGDSLIAAADARGVVEFDGGSMMRLDGGTEVALSSGAEGVITDIVEGSSYHRVVDGSSYMVRSGGVKVTAEGTAFTFDVREDMGRVMSLQSSVELELEAGTRLETAWNSRLEEGQVFDFSGVAREEDPSSHISDITRNDLDNEWLRWNKGQDEDLGLPLGVLSLLDEGQADGGQPPPPPPADQQQTPSTPNNQPSPQPSPQPQPAPTPQPETKSVVLSAQASEGLVSFNWTVTGYSGFQGFKLCRSETNPSPSYPNDWWKYVDGENARSTSDNTVQAGHTYYYRVGVYSQGSVLGYSNAVQVTVPGQAQELSISLSATVVAGKVKLSWSVSGQGSYDGFKVCRSETNPSPSYPAEGLTFIAAGQYSYTDAAVTSGHTYYYRVGIYAGGSILKYSNAVQVTVP